MKTAAAPSSATAANTRPRKPAPHLQKKLDYLERKDLVASSEDFIERAATQSSLSGKPYQVRCATQTRNSADWLNQELRRLRQAPDQPGWPSTRGRHSIGA